MIAIGIPLRGPVDESVLIGWISVLRGHHLPGPTYDWRDLYPCQARNMITERFLDGPADALWMFDSDQVPPYRFESRFSTQIVEEDAERYPMTCGLVYMRQEPYEPVVYDMKLDGRYFAKPERIAQMVEKRGVYQIASYGSGCLILQRKLLEHLRKHKAPKPIWEADPNFDLDEGWRFCHDVTALGYKIWLDSRLEAPHIARKPITSKEYLVAHGYGIAD